MFLSNTLSYTDVPSRVWGYTLGGYQVIKKWLSYREASLLGPALDANYAAVKADLFAWPRITSAEV